MKNKTWIWIVAAVLALALLVGGMVALYLKFRPQAVDGVKHFTVAVVHKDGTKKDFTYESEEEYLGTVLKNAGLIDGDEGEFGLMISTVDGEIADYNVDQSYWWLLVNGQDAVAGIDLTPIEDGAVYTLEYRFG